VIEKSDRGSGNSFVLGIAAGAVAIAISLLIRSFAGGSFIPELASQTLFSLTPGQFESQAVENFGPLAKYSAFAGAIIIYFILYGLFAVLLIRLHDKLHWEGYVRRAILASVVAYLILLILAITLITITEARTHTQATSITRLVISLILPQIAFGFTLSSFSVKIRRASRKPGIEKPSGTATEIDYKKRALLRAVIASAVAVPILYLGLNRLFSTEEVQIPQTSTSLLPPQSRSKPVGFEDPRLTPLLDSEITLTYLFYRIDTNPIVPVVDATSWSLNVKGLVNTHLTITYER
jgi:heme/copper-type cytochrome/quinol oxidase subunit 2